MKKPITERVGDFLAGRGFYIVLFLCIAAIGISGYYLMNVLSAPSGPDPVTALDPVESVEVPTPTLTPPPAETVTPTPPPAETTAPPPAETAPAPQTVSIFTWPVRGDVLAGYSLQALCYDETMGDWRTHSGMDIAAAEGTQVLAVADGTVTAVYDDPWLGTTVTLSHAGNLQSSYSNLAGKPPVAEGDTIRCGEVLGSVGKTTLAEAGMEAHLHLEMTADGETVDPVNYLPQ